jgi:hypothetical protein
VQFQKDFCRRILGVFSLLKEMLNTSWLGCAGWLSAAQSTVSSMSIEVVWVAIARPFVQNLGTPRPPARSDPIQGVRVRFRSAT